MRLRALRKRDRHQAIALLEQDSDGNLFQLDSLEKRAFSSWYQDQWWGVFKNRSLIGIGGCFGRASHGEPAKLIIPYGTDSAMFLLGQFEKERGGTKMAIGVRSATDAFLEGLDVKSFKTHYDQRIYRCTETNEYQISSEIVFQRAKQQHLEKIYNHSAKMMIEDLGTDPRTPIPSQHHETIKVRIQEGRCFIGTLKGKIVFLLDLGTNCNRGCQIGGTYVPPEFREKGYATEGVHFWTKRLLKKYGLVTLHVNEANHSAIRLYNKIGFKQSSPYRLAII
jgi:predicted GNAT family acetyltransferase